jgi:hypothetical protein
MRADVDTIDCKPIIVYSAHKFLTRSGLQLHTHAVAVACRSSCRHRRSCKLPTSFLQARTCEVNATENSRMTPETTDSVSCTQKPIQPYLLIACVALEREDLAASPSLPVESGPPNDEGLYEGCCCGLYG